MRNPDTAGSPTARADVAHASLVEDRSAMIPMQQSSTDHRRIEAACQRMQDELAGDVLLDQASLGRYSTDASIYQQLPFAVVFPRTQIDIETVLDIARRCGVPVLSRGGGTSQNGQTVNRAIVMDYSRYFNKLIELDVEARRVRVQPGMVLDSLNRQLRPHGLWFPVDVSTATRATIGGMAGNNSCGQRSIVYGTMRDNVQSMRVITADGVIHDCGEVNATNLSALPSATRDLYQQAAAISARHEATIRDRFPQVLRRVGGYNLDALLPHQSHNLAHLLVGSEGTLALALELELKLSPLPHAGVIGVCHFPTFYQAMDAAQHLVALSPSAVELVDATMIGLARDIEVFKPTVEKFVRGQPEALLLVEFARPSDAENQACLQQLHDCMRDLGFDWRGQGQHWGGVVEALDKPSQAALADMRTSGLNIMMSMKSEGKPVSFVEDCAVDLAHLAEYTRELTEVFTRYGTTGTWYAHASVGCLHVRPVLNLKLDNDLEAMREIADAAFDLVLKYKGSHSGEHGDGISRSEFHEKMFGAELVNAFSSIKQLFDPVNLLNPGRIVNAPRMNERQLLRYHSDYQAAETPVALHWKGWSPQSHGLQAAVEMCNNNGACRKLKGGAMCPSYRATRDEQHVTRGRANTLRLALSGQLQADDPGDRSGTNPLAAAAVQDAMRLCVSCKACRRECPTGVDMARMKIESLAARADVRRPTLHERCIDALPDLAWRLSRSYLGRRLANARNHMPRLARLLQRPSGFAADRRLPEFHEQAFQDYEANDANPQVLLWADTFNRFFEPGNLRAAVAVLRALGYRVAVASAASAAVSADHRTTVSQPERPLCCGRTRLSTGNVVRARAELQRCLDHLVPALKDGAVVVGLEPSCLLTLRDELPALLPGNSADTLATSSFLFEEFLVRELTQSDGVNADGSPSVCTDRLRQLQQNFNAEGTTYLVHTHCHQKAFNLAGTVETVMKLIPGATVRMIDSGCCGMAGAFGYHHETQKVSRQMAELDLLPAIAADDNAVLVADGTSCRHQIRDLAGREARHVARVLQEALLPEHNAQTKQPAH